MSKNKKSTEVELCITDHTKTFLEIRNVLHPEEILPLEREKPPWFQIKEEVEEKFDLLRKEINQLAEVMEAPPRILIGFEMKSDIDQRCTRLTNDFDNCFKLVSDLEQCDKSDEQHAICKNLHSKYCSKLATMLDEFRKMQTRYIRAVEGPLVQGEENEEDFYMSPQMYEQDQNLETIRYEEESAIMRRNEYQKIHKEINDIKNLSRQIYDLVIEQGTLMDRIDQNLVNAIERISEGNENIQVTIKMGQTNLIYWVVLLVSVVIFSIVVIVMIRLKRG